jgi:hypothetical protein
VNAPPNLFLRKENPLSVQNIPLKARALRAIHLQEQGTFIVDKNNELPLPTDKVQSELTSSHERDEQGQCYDYQCGWGRFFCDPEERSLLTLRRGNPPNELLPQPQLALATATMHTGFVAIHNNGSSFELDLKTPDKPNWGVLRLVNETLRNENIPVVVWELDEAQGETPPVIRITNESAMVFASSAIWSIDDQQLVAAQVVSTSQDLLKAIKASLANNNSKSYVTIKTPDDSAYLKGARKGYVTVGNNLAQANAEGTVTALLHPLSGDPQANTAEHFYLVVIPGESLPQKFAERLDLAIPWPIQPEWADYLLETGQKAGLVQHLNASGTDFAAGLRIVKNESQWQQVIASGLKAGQISIQ